MMRMRTILLLSAVILAPGCSSLTSGPATSSSVPSSAPGNKAERLAWFQDLGLGMFIHWSVDCQLGVVISHSMANAEKAYLDRFVKELPRTFDPDGFEPRKWARLARLVGMRYVVFTTKHHSGFCMWNTKTTEFNVMRTPYGRDITRQIVDAFRAEGLAIGFYFSPDDFSVLYRQGHDVTRRRPEAQPLNNPELMAHDKAQIRELLTRYGPVDIMFLDGPAEGLRELCWQLQPDIVVTRGAMQTPEQRLPGEAIPGPWEACFTMGNEWNYKPTNEQYKSGTEVIRMLAEIRAKGGNLLLNIGPQPDGRIPVEQESRLRELALWMFVNREAVIDTRPWVVTNEGDIWLTGRDDTVYAICTGEPWPWEQWKTITLKSVRATAQSEIEVVGQTGRTSEYKVNLVPKATWTQDAAGLHIKAMHAQRMYTNNKWPNPIVIRIRHAVPADPAKKRPTQSAPAMPTTTEGQI